jgi:hypothetical protein
MSSETQNTPYVSWFSNAQDLKNKWQVRETTQITVQSNFYNGRASWQMTGQLFCLWYMQQNLTIANYVEVSYTVKTLGAA